MSVTLSQLLEESPKLEVARAEETVAAAMERMVEHDYSQLPVVADGGTQLRAIGVISTETIARASLYLDAPPSQLRVKHAIDEHPITRKLGDDLWRTLDEARDGQVLLVEDDRGVLRGVLTGQDFTTYLRRQSEDSLTVLDIEHTMKQLILEHYRDREAALREVVETELGVHQRSLEKGVRGVVMRCLSAVSIKPGDLDQGVFKQLFEKQFPDTSSYDFDRLNFNQYQQILLGEACWAAYRDEFDLPIERLRALLTIARDLRNQIMHNRGLPTPTERAKLVYCRGLLSRVADRRQEPVAVGDSEAVVVEPSAIAELPEVAVTPDEVDDTASGSRSGLTAVLESLGLGTDRIVLPFEELDELFTGGLPAAAQAHRSWWTNDEESPQSAQWLDASWRVVSVNLTAGMVTFGRNTAGEEACLVIFGRIFRRLAASQKWSLPTPSPAARTSQVLVDLSPESGAARVKLGFTKGERFWVWLSLDADDHGRNKASLDALAEQRDELERSVGASLEWERKPHRRGSSVGLYYPRSVSIRSGEEAIDELASWVAEYVPRFCAAMQAGYTTVE